MQSKLGVLEFGAVVERRGDGTRPMTMRSSESQKAGLRVAWRQKADIAVVPYLLFNNIH